MKRLLSGIQPSGDLHIGNYFGAINQWKGMLDNYDALCMVVNYHALTSMFDGAELRRLTRELVVGFVASGLDPEKCTIFLQSDVPEHTEMTWILSCVTSTGLLERSHAYKDKIAKGMTPNAGLFLYPVLMAVDILAYDPDCVPVGKDQKQHVEMTRDMAEKFNHVYGDTFKLPEPVIPVEVAVVPGIDGQKMSKSYGNEIPLFCDEATLKKKVMSIVTDSAGVEEEKDPSGNTIFELYKLVASDDEIVEMDRRFREGGYGYGEAKKELLGCLTKFLQPIWEKRDEVLGKDGYIEDVLAVGKKRAQAMAKEKLGLMREKVGL